MAEPVYSAARANSWLKGKTQEDAWNKITQMFPIPEPENVYSAKSFIYGGYPLQERVKNPSGDTQIGVGDVFKAKTIHNTNLYVTITKWAPCLRFSYTEQMWTEGMSEPSVAHITEFAFLEHPEGTVIEIVRKECGEVKTGLLKRLFVGDEHAQWAAGRLGHIIQGEFIKLKKNGQSQQVGDFTITRDDSLRRR